MAWLLPAIVGGDITPHMIWRPFMIRMYNRTIATGKGSTCIEYAMIASIVSVVIIAALYVIRGQLIGIYASIAKAF